MFQKPRVGTRMWIQYAARSNAPALSIWEINENLYIKTLFTTGAITPSNKFTMLTYSTQSQVLLFFSFPGLPWFPFAVLPRVYLHLDQPSPTSIRKLVNCSISLIVNHSPRFTFASLVDASFSFHCLFRVCCCLCFSFSKTSGSLSDMWEYADIDLDVCWCRDNKREVRVTGRADNP